MSDGAKSLVLTHPEAFRLGCQGADVFFFHHMLRPKKSRRQVGAFFHQRNVDTCLAAMLEFSRHGGAALPYFLGYLCHYALDCIAHPYINHRCCNRDHTRFEAHLDSALIRYLGHDLTELPPYMLIGIGEAALREIDAFYAQTARIAFGQEIQGLYEESWRHMVNIQHISYDPRRMKRPFFALLERIAGQPHLITGKLFDRKNADSIDYLNLSKQEWCLPWEEKTVFTDDFPTLMERAAERAAALSDVVYRCHMGAPKEEALAQMGGNSLDTGMDWRENPAFHAVKCVYSHKPQYQ